MLNLHTHSEYSFKDAIAKVEDIAKKHKELGVNSFCITDHGTMGAFPEAFRVAKKLNMKFIPGCEFYITPPYEFDLKQSVIHIGEARKIVNKKSEKEDVKDAARAVIQEWESRDCRKNFHLTVLAKNQTGLNNLFHLYSTGETYYKYRVTSDNLFKFKEGLIVLSGCLGSELSFYVKSRQEDLAHKLIEKYKSEFGDDYYIEIQFHGLEPYEKEKLRNYRTEIETYKRLIELAKEHNVKLICTNDSHYINKEDYALHQMYKKISFFKDKKEDHDAITWNGQRYHIMGESEIRELFESVGYDYIDEMINSIKEVDDKVDHGIYPPETSILKHRDDILREKTMAGWEKIRKGTKYEEESLKRIEHELKVIKEKNFSNYFLNVAKLCNKAKEMNILTGPGRGSGAGSEVVYLLGITQTDPLKYGLMFERFMNPDRYEMPDIDTDIESKVAMESVEGDDEEVKLEMGAKLIVQALSDHFKFHGRIGNVVRKSSLVMFKDLCSFLGVKYSDVNKFTTNSVTKQIFNKDEKPTREEFYSNLSSLGIEINEKWAEVYKYINICYLLKNIPSGSSIHASGVIAAEDELCLPIDDNGVINFNGVSLEEMGFTKYDLLSLDSLNPIKHFYGVDINWQEDDDPEVWKVFLNADTDYVFQLGGDIPKRMMRGIVKENENGELVGVTSIDELAEISSINRPGPLAEKLNEVWVQVKNGEYHFDGDQAVVRDILKDSFGEKHSGLLVFQEDCMRVAVEACGFSITESDHLRKGIGKKKQEILDEYHPKFVNGWNNYYCSFEIEGLGEIHPLDKLETDKGIIKGKDLLISLNKGEVANVKSVSKKFEAN